MSEVTAKDLRKWIEVKPVKSDAYLAAFDAMAEKAELLDEMTRHAKAHLKCCTDVILPGPYGGYNPRACLNDTIKKAEALKAVPE